jgi:hypothetical protein
MSEQQHPATPADEPPKREYRMLSGIAESQAAIGEVVGCAQRLLRIFDITLAQRGFNTPARIEQLRQFLVAGRAHRILIAPDETDPLERDCPRLRAAGGELAHEDAEHGVREPKFPSA